MLPAEVEQGNTLPSFYSSHIVCKCPSHKLLSDTVFSLFVHFIDDFTVKWPIADLPRSAAEHKKAVVCLMEKMHVFENSRKE